MHIVVQLLRPKFNVFYRYDLGKKHFSTVKTASFGRYIIALLPVNRTGVLNQLTLFKTFNFTDLNMRKRGQ